MKDVRIPLLVAVTAIIGYAAMAMLSGCRNDSAVYGVTCYSHGQAILDTESEGRPERVGSSPTSFRFTETHTGKRFEVTGECVIVKESP